MITLLCPSRKRPELAKRMWESAGRIGRLYLGITHAELNSYRETAEESYVVPVAFPDNLPTVHKWNLLAQKALEHPANKLFMLAADDMIFATQGWSDTLIQHYSALENKIHVYALQDSRDKDGTPHPIVTREYIEKMGYFMPPWFLHWQIDTWTVEIAKANNCFTHLKDFRLIHDKPSDRGEPDETHNRIREWGWHERDRYVAEKSKHILEIEKQRLRA